MNKILKSWSTMILFILLILTPASQVKAESTETSTAETKAEAAGTRLFTVQISDGYTKTLVPVYETVSASGTASLKADIDALTVNPASKKVTAKIVKRSSHYKANYTSVSVTKKAALASASASKKLTVKAVSASGTAYKCRITVTRPAEPAIASVTPKSKSVTLGSRLSFTVKTTTKVPVKLVMKVTNGSATVLKKTAGSSTNENQKFIWYWDGKNKSGEYVQAGTYKVTAYLSYQNGKKTKTVKKSTKVTVTEKTTNTADNTAAADGTKSSKTWDWKVMVTGDSTVDYLAEYICQQVLTPGMTEVQRAKALYTYSSTNWTSLRTNTWNSAVKAGAKAKIDISSSAAKKRIKAYKQQVDQMIAAGTAEVNTSGSVTFAANNTKTAMVMRTGDCLNMARMYQVLCRHAGLDSDILQNGLAGSDPLHHFWNVVKIGSSWYECDPRMAFLRKEGFVHFLRGTKFMESINLKEGNGTDDVRRYGSISSKAAYQAVYKKVSKADCPGR